MILDTDSLTFLDNQQIYATPTDGGGNVSYTPYTDSPAPAPTDTLSTQQSGASTVPFTAPKIFRFAAPTGSATDVNQPSSGLTTTTFGVAPVATVAAPTTTQTTTQQTTATTGTAPLTGSVSGGSVTGSGDDLISRLIDLMAAQYTGAHVTGGGSGFGGLVSGPLAGSDFVGGDTSAAPASSNKKGLLILLLLVAGIGYWFYRSHKKKKAA